MGMLTNHFICGNLRERSNRATVLCNEN